MDNWRSKIFGTLIIASLLLATVGDCKKRPPPKKPSKNETTLLKFVWLVVYRVVHGFASWFGGQEAIEEFMGGILVPPGAEDTDADGDDDDDDGGGDYRDYAEEYKDDDYY